jgi:hypothetical protein
MSFEGIRFEVGRFYRHSSGVYLSILCEAETTLYGRCLIAESAGEKGGFRAVGIDQASAENYIECSKEEWMSNFD